MLCYFSLHFVIAMVGVASLVGLMQNIYGSKKTHA